jgi:tetratricopeptide (TPR) repeat protein
MRTDDQVESGQAHPSDEELRQALSANTAEARPAALNADEVQRHLQTCDLCQLRRDVLQKGGWSGARPASGHCPDVSVWYAVAGGTAKLGEAREWLAHASQCSACAETLQGAIDDMSSDFTAEENAAMDRLMTSRPEWPRDFARRLMLEHSGLKPSGKPRWFDWKVLMAAVASATAAAVVGWQVYMNSALHVEHLLASAYQENRTFEFRLPDSPYAEQGIALRGPQSELPQDLSDAYAISRRKAADHPNSARWLDLKGRSELLAGSPDKAIATLLAAEEQAPSDVGTLNDLSVAYALRFSGSSNPEDLAAALRYNELVLQKTPNDSVALFNRALLEARVPDIGNATSAMSRFLALYPDSPWAAEARRKLADWERMLREHSAAPDETPQGYLRALGDSEAYVESAVRDWLPKSTDPTAGAALQKLSAELLSQHEDGWLHDVLNQRMDDLGMRALASAAEENLEGDYSGAIRDADAARQRLDQVGARAAVLRAEFELTYAEQRLLSGKSCGPHARQLVEEVQGSGYPYLEGQALLESAACQEFVENFAQSMRDVDRAIAVTERAKLRAIGLRALGFKATFESDQGNPFRMWEICQAGLRKYWGAWAPDIRAQHFLVEMEDWAEKEAEWPLAKSLQQEVLRTIEYDPDDDLKAMAHLRMARVALASGDTTTSDREFRSAAELFASAPDPRTARLHAAESRVALAGIQLRRGSVDDAQESLRSVDRLLQKNAEDIPYYLQVEYQGVRGDLALAQNRLDVAQSAYATGVQISEDALPSLPDAASRARLSEATEHAYRGLATILIAKGDSNAALRLWQKRCSAALVRSRNSHLLHDAVPPPRQLKLTYLVLEDKVAIWSSIGGSNTFRAVELRRDSLEREARSLIYLCSRPDADSIELHALARKLYQQLVNPIEPDLLPSSEIVVQPDASLSDLPFEVLEDSSGAALGERYQFLYSPSLGGHNPADEPLTAGASLVLLGDSTFDAGAQTGLEDEVQSFRRLYPRSVVMDGRNTSREMLTKSLQIPELLEFVGHGHESFTGAGLLVREERPGHDSVVLDAGLLESLALPQMKLAVLSACSTARGRNGLLDSRSLVLSFLQAGVGSVVASRWDVDSVSTARLMAAFHQNLARGQSIPEALRMASNDMRRQMGNQPFYWAAFSVYE